jgi:cytochrome P450
MRDKNLYRDVVLTDRIAHQDDSDFHQGGSRIVTNAATIDRLTRTRPSPFVEQSAFFRTHASNPLPAPLRRTLRKQLIRLTHSAQAQNAMQAIRFPDGKHATQGWGISMVLRHLMPIICGDRNVRLQELTQEYVERVIIASNVRGVRKARQAEVSAGIWKQMEPYVAELRPPKDEPRDLVDVALSIRDEITLQELPEVYARLVLSTVGFTGIALEWAVIRAGERSKAGKQWIDATSSLNIISECQRIAPTAWKLIRETDPLGDGAQLEKVILMTSTIQRSARNWDRPLEFDPSRWDSAEPSSSVYFPFGKHDMVCPARQFALDYLTAALDSVREHQDIKVLRTLRRPRAHILFVPAPRRFELHAKRQQ